MTYISKFNSAATALALALSIQVMPVSASSAIWQTEQYRSDKQYTVYCGAALLCDITLEPGERINAGLGSLAQMWDSQEVVAGENPSTAHLVLKPYKAGLRENVIISTNRRIYRLYIVSTTSESPTYVQFLFNQERHIWKSHTQRVATTSDTYQYLRLRAQHHRMGTPQKLSELDRACTSIQQTGWNTDRTPSAFVPRKVCQSTDHTYIAMPMGPMETNDLPIPSANTPDGDRPVEYRYDPKNRVFVIDGTGTDYVLIANTGRHQTRLRIQRNDTQAQPHRRKRHHHGN